MQYRKNRINHAKKMRRAALLFAVLITLYGCTKKDEILLLEEETVLEEVLPETSEESEEADVDSENEQINGSLSVAEEKGLIYVHVCGAVKRPGVYEMKAGSRVYEAVQAAGGFGEAAEQNYVNQAQVLTDGVKLVIPTAEEAAVAGEEERQEAAQTKNDAGMQIGIVTETLSGETGGEADGPGDGRININTASKEQLCQIPGIGDTRAAAIMAYRDKNGGFKKPEDIMQVSGIKEGMYEKIRDSICVN